MKSQIRKLRSEGKTYDDIAQIVGCSKSTIAYHCSNSVKQKSHSKRQQNKRALAKKLKVEFGGQCSICGYNKCFTSLHFHHENPADKTKCVMNVLVDNGYKAAQKEAKKCILICSNCHGEIEEKKRGTYD